MSNMTAGIIQLGSMINELKGSDRNFAESLFNFFQQKGRLSDKQAMFIPKLIEKAEANIKAKNTPITSAVCTRPAAKVGDFSRVIQIFDTAKASEHKRPKVRFFSDKLGKIALSAAPDTGRNPGWVYIKVEEEFMGMINREGEFKGSGSKNANLIEALSEFAMEPKDVIKKFGYKTGSCGLCGRKLTDKTSIAIGVGPICLDSYGF